MRTKTKYEDMTDNEWLIELSRQPALLEAARAVVEAAIANTEAVKLWRGYFNGNHPPTQREQKARVDRVTETRTALDEAVDAYRNTKVMAKCQPSLAKLDKLDAVSTAGQCFTGITKTF